MLRVGKLRTKSESRRGFEVPGLLPHQWLWDSKDFLNFCVGLKKHRRLPESFQGPSLAPISSGGETNLAFG